MVFVSVLYLGQQHQIYKRLVANKIKLSGYVSNSPLLDSVTDLHPEETIYVTGQKNALGFDVRTLNIFCWAGRPKLISHYFESALLRLHIENEDFVQYQGPTPEAVLQDIEDKKSLFNLNFLWSSKRDRVPLNVFNNTCVGVETAQEYKLILQIIPYETAKILLLVAGALLLFVSGRLSKNSLFFYICGVSFGVGASFLILVYFISKILPRKALMYGSLVCGWTLVFYFGQMMWQNFQMLAQTYREYLLYYCLFTGIVSFIICYRYGPPTDQRSQNLIMWGLQSVAMFAIWQSTDLKECALVVCLLLITIYYAPKCSPKWLRWPTSKKRHFISAAEFEEQGRIETEKALEELKRFCGSPECNQWKTITRLKHPSRFASFIEGDSHLMDSEIIDYETTEFNQYSEDEEDNEDNFSDRDDGSDSRNDDAIGDHLISEEDDYEEPTPKIPSRRGNSIGRRDVYADSSINRSQQNRSANSSQMAQRRIIANSRFRAERTPTQRVSNTPKPRVSRKYYHLSDED